MHYPSRFENWGTVIYFNFWGWDQIKNTFWDYPTFTYFKKLMLKLSLINNILPTMPTCPPLFQSWIFTILFCCMCILLLFFSNFCTWVLGAHIFQGTNTHSPAAINLTPTFCRIFLLANHSLLRTSVLAWFGSKQFQLLAQSICTHYSNLSGRPDIF